MIYSSYMSRSHLIIKSACLVPQKVTVTLDVPHPPRARQKQQCGNFLPFSYHQTLLYSYGRKTSFPKALKSLLMLSELMKQLERNANVFPFLIQPKGLAPRGPGAFKPAKHMILVL